MTETTDTTTRMTRLFWFLRGIMIGVLLMGTANALSYFFRSTGWGSLLGNRVPDEEAIGFPVEVWRASASHKDFGADYAPLLVNITVALVVGALCGWVLVWQRGFLNQMIADFEHEQRQSDRQKEPFQFTLRSLLIATVLAALAAVAVKRFASQPESLLVIYVLGPLMLVVLALLPYRIPWQQRVAILTPATLAMIGVAIAIGVSLNIDFDVVLMGIFICWVPQTALAAVALTVWIIAQYVRSNRNVRTPSTG